LDDVAVFFAEGAVADERGQAEVESVGEGAGFGGPGVGGARAAQTAVQVVELVCYDALEIGIFLVRADDVWRGGEGVGRRSERGWCARLRWLRGHVGRRQMKNNEVRI
jgi:hypothetical protein